MAAVGGEPTGACHIVAVPYPGRGHVNPMMNLCSSLALRNSRTLVTFVVTEEWLGLIGSEARPANFRFATLPNVLPSELDRAADVAGFVEAVHTKMEEPFERLLDRLEPPARVIVADTFLCWAGDVGNRSNIPVASLWTMPAAVFSILYHFELLVENGDYPVEDLKREKRVDYIPGVSPIRLADLPSILLIKDRRLLRRALLINPAVAKSQSLLLNSISELETPVITALRSILPVPIYSVGPLIPRSALQDHPSRPIARDGSDYLRWLDSQPQGSVLYVSLGSFLSVSRTQIDEISNGLRDSGVSYLWAVRGEASRLREDSGKGMVVEWCEQLRVLCHSSVGGFWSHCGWNSTMESIYAGVPMLGFPLLMDQLPISKFVEDDWGIGWRVKRGKGLQDLVRGEKIAELVRRFMDSRNDEREGMVRRGRELREISRRAIEKGGSSDSSMDGFIKGILLS